MEIYAVFVDVFLIILPITALTIYFSYLSALQKIQTNTTVYN